MSKLGELELEELVDKIRHSNIMYRMGTPIISDSEWDSLLEDLETRDPNNPLLSEIGFSLQEEDTDRKSKLPVPMYSANKIKSIEDLEDWSRLKDIPTQTVVIITPKLDGISLCEEKGTGLAWTRGDGIWGQRSDQHFKQLNDSPVLSKFKWTWGEVIMPKSTFNQKYSEEFANPRNLVGGLLNSKEASEILIDCKFIRYGGVPVDGSEFKTKQEIIEALNLEQGTKIPYHMSKIGEVTEDLVIDLFNKWSIEYEIDGLVIEIDDLELQSQMGRETNKNPSWLRAFKHPNFEQTAITEVIGISWNISKWGLLKPIIHIKPVRLDGVVVSNVTGNNARFVKEMGIGVGALIKVKRSGMVIPMVVETIHRVDFVLPQLETEIKWNDNGIELVTVGETDEQKIKKIISFFEILGADGVSSGIINQLWVAGYQTIGDILKLERGDFEKIEGFGKRKAEIVWKSIKKSTTNVSLPKLQHATGIFAGLGSKKLALLVDFVEKPKLEDVLQIEGFAEKSARVYIDSWDTFREFIKDLPITIRTESPSSVGGDLSGEVFVFTGVRDGEAEGIIVGRGGKIGSSVSKNTTYLVCKDPNASSGKLEKAKSMGVKIISISELRELIK
jgi:DNA ligase (NAD+)